METKIVFATSEEFPQLTEDDLLAVEALNKHGIGVTPALWDDLNFDWGAYSTVVIRSCWDYHLRPIEFSNWLTLLEKLGVAIWNPAEVVRWNMDKTYLSELQQQGVAILPSVWLPRYAKVNLAHLLEEKNWTQAVVKPTISAAADNTFLVSLESVTARQAKFDQLLQQGGLLVQEFAPEVQERGEWSLMFFGGQYSHAVLKRPAGGDFRVQRHLGGSHGSAEPARTLVDQAAAAVSAAGADLLYARVDGIERAGSLFLMELEIIEPLLFFADNPKAPDHFAEVLIKQLAMKESDHA